MSEIDRHILSYFAKHPNKGAGDIPPLAGHKIPRQTLSRRLTALVEKGELIRTGQGAGTRYLRGDWMPICGPLRRSAHQRRICGNAGQASCPGSPDHSLRP